MKPASESCSSRDPTRKFPGAGNFCRGFFLKVLFPQILPKIERFDSRSREHAGIYGNFLFNCFPSWDLQPFFRPPPSRSRELAGNFGPDRGVPLCPRLHAASSARISAHWKGRREDQKSSQYSNRVVPCSQYRSLRKCEKCSRTQKTDPSLQAWSVLRCQRIRSSPK
jgi:hypothetical protein